MLSVYNHQGNLRYQLDQDEYWNKFDPCLSGKAEAAAILGIHDVYQLKLNLEL